MLQGLALGAVCVPPRRGVAGFTIFETIIALAIAGIALAALLGATQTGLGNARLAAEYVEATRRAQSLLDTVGIGEALIPGERSGSDEGGYSWQLRIAPPLRHAASAAANTPAPPQLYDVEVTISWSGGGRQRRLSIRSQRLGPAPPGNA